MDKSWKAEKTKTINVRLTEYEYKCLANSAESSKMNISHLVRFLIHEIFDESEEKEENS